MAIEEQKESAVKDSTFNGVEIHTNPNAGFQSKFNIESSICYCDRAPGPSQNIRPRPHFKADYCLGNETKQKVTTKNDVLKKIEPPKNSTYSSPNVNSSNVSKSIQEKSCSFTKPKSIFSYAMPAKRSSSVIIEDLPSEACNYNSADNKNKECLCKTIHKNRNDADKVTRESNVRNTTKYREDNSNTKLSPRKIQVADKYENKTSKSEKYVSMVTLSAISMEEKIRNLNGFYYIFRILKASKMDTSSCAFGNR